MDNADPHNSGRAQSCGKASRAEHLPHSAYGPDLAPSDFILFGYIIGKLSDDSYESRENLLKAIAEVFSGVDQEVPVNVFQSWVSSLKW
jgi:hypothetical protein